MQKWLKELVDSLNARRRGMACAPESMEPEVVDVVDAAIDYASSALRDTFYDFVQRCESPIERLFAATICYRSTPEIPSNSGWRPQVEIGRYRADFVYVYPDDDKGPRYKVAVELDGHDFHEKTKEQAGRDKRKDRALLAAGYYVMRFTGSEVWADPWKCVDEVEEFAFEKWRENSDDPYIGGRRGKE